VPAAHGNVLVYDKDTTNRSLHGLGPFGRIDISGVQPIWTWGQLTAARDAANAGYEARSLLVKDQVATVQLRVIQLFWAEALANRLLAIAHDVEHLYSGRPPMAGRRRARAAVATEELDDD